MGIILPVNDSCRIESDNSQWVVMQRCGDNWVARTFWQCLASAALDCVFLGLAKPNDMVAIQPFVDRLAQAISRVAALAAGRETGDLDADLGSLWRVSAKGNPETSRLHWVLTCRDTENPDSNRRTTMGAYRRLGYALRQCLLMRLRQANSFDSLEAIADEIEKFALKPSMAI